LPELYEKNDELNHRGDSKQASVIWKRDLKKKELAEGWGYDVVYIWETEMNEMTDNELISELRVRLELDHE